MPPNLNAVLMIACVSCPVTLFVSTNKEVVVGLAFNCDVRGCMSLAIHIAGKHRWALLVSICMLNCRYRVGHI